MKVHAIPHAIVEPTRPGFIQILHHCSAEFMKDNSSVFFSSNLIYLGKKVLVSGWVKIYQILHVNLKPQLSFPLNFASLFTVMRGNSSVPF